MANMITMNYMEGLGKQIFSRDFIINGLFPCQSAFTKMINLARIDWKFNDKFEYRMLMSNTNSGGTINTQTFDENFRLLHPGQLEYGIFRATYGAVMDGFTIDMTKQLETKESRAAFNKEYAMRLHSMRINVASLFKNIMIHGRYMPAHRIMPPLARDDGTQMYIPQWRPAGSSATSGWVSMPIIGGSSTPGVHDIFAGAYFQRPGGLSFIPGDHVRFTTPRNVYNTNFKHGRLLNIATTEAFDVNKTGGTTVYGFAAETSGRFAPWGKSFIGDMWAVYDNQAGMLDLVYIGPPRDQVVGGTDGGRLYVGSYFIVAGNRRAAHKDIWAEWKLSTISNYGYPWQGPDPNVTVDNNVARGASFDFVTNNPDGWDPQGLSHGTVEQWRWDCTNISRRNALYTERTGAMEGAADLFPWYTTMGSYDPNQLVSRLGINRPFRAQPHRLRYTSEQAGQLILQQRDQSIMNAIMTGVDVATSVCDWEDLVIFINPTTLSAIGMYEQFSGGNTGGLQVFKESQMDTKLIYQRGITGISFRIGEKIIPNVVKDWNFPTDVILLAPMRDLQYNCWDNAAFELSQYIQDTFSGKKPPPPKDVAVPKEFLTRMDLSSRIIYGAPVAADLTHQGLGYDNGFIHPSNSMPVAYQEMGALFTENPYAYTVVKLCNQIVNVEDTLMTNWACMVPAA